MSRRAALAAALAAIVALAVGIVVAVGGDDDATTTTGSTTTGRATTSTSAAARTSTTRQRPGSTTTAPGTPGSTATTALPSLASLRVRLTLIGSFDQPVELALRLGDRAMYVAEKPGRIVSLQGTRRAEILDISGEVASDGEQGLLGAAFSPDGDFLYVHYTNNSGDTRIVEYAFSEGRPQTSTRRQVLAVDQPYPNHNGGKIAFGPDGYLYIGLGDGGSGGDPHGNGQRLDTLLGKLLRIDPRPSGGAAYRVPASNPFVGRSGARGEIWSYGLRNPWRFSFDRSTGDLWIGDVGQNAVEEVDFDAAGGGAGRGDNFGWNRMEGDEVFEGAAPANHHPPIHTYANGDRTCAVTGGVVYRGSRVPALRGTYLFGDFCAGRVIGLRQRAGQAAEVEDLGAGTSNLAAFAEDAAGEVYALSLSGGVYRVDAG